MADERDDVLELGDLPPGRVSVVNESGLDDGLVLDGVKTYFAETASVGGIANSTFGTYQGDGSLLARRKWTPPRTVIEEIKLARDMAERDDDIGAAMGTLMATAFADGMENLHRDERTASFFNSMARNTNLDGALKEMYREYLIAGQFTTISLYTRDLLTYTPTAKGARGVKKQVAAPLIGVLPSEQIRVDGDDTFRNAGLLYKPEEREMEKWLSEFFDPGTTAARKAEMRRDKPVWAAAFIERVKLNDEDDDLFVNGIVVYRLNPRMVKRTCMPKGAWAYPRPLMTRNFALLEAKRLLNIMDYALLQGGTNYLVVAKKGSDQKPATAAEVQNLYSVISTASKSGVIVGDHRLSIEIVTPKLEELLNAEKRSLIGRKMAMAMMRVPENPTAGLTDDAPDMDILGRVVTSDRRDIKRHVETIYEDTAKRNPSTFTQGAPSLWFPKIVLTGQDAFNQQVLKLRDRGDIPRKWAVEAAGYDYEASVEQRRREIANGDDEILTPGSVPFSTDGATPEGGRPAGASQANGAPGSQPRQRGDRPMTPAQRLARARGETVRAWYDEDENAMIRVGDLTYAILEQYAATRTVGRVTKFERRALEAPGITQEGPLAVVPVNLGYETEDERAVRLARGLSMIVGERKLDGAVVAKALCFREPEFTLSDAEETALRWGFITEAVREDTEPEPEGEE